MNKTTIAVAIAAAVALCAFAGESGAQAKRDTGKREYESKCAVCHGKTGKGDGPFIGLIQGKRGADLTTLQKKNGGVFPILRVTDTIDGRFEIAEHGPRDMPIWGADFLAGVREETRQGADNPWDAEAYVKYRVYALTEYVYRLQVK